MPWRRTPVAPAGALQGAVVGAVLVLLLGACTGGGAQKPGAGGGSGAGGGAGPSTTATGSASTIPNAVLASPSTLPEPGVVNPLPWRVDILSLSRTADGFVELTFRATNTGTTNRDIIGLFDQVGGPAAPEPVSIGGVTVVDPAGGVGYPVVRDSLGDCVCTSFNGTVIPNGSLTVSALFPPVPATVTKLQVSVRNFAPVLVPLSAASPLAAAPTSPGALFSLDNYGNVLELDITGVQRDRGGLVVVSFKMVNHGPTFADFIGIENDQSVVHPSGYHRQVTSVNGMFAVDPKGRIMYWPVHDGDGTCLCTEVGGEYNSGSSLDMYADFPPIPASATVLDLQLPGFPIVAVQLPTKTTTVVPQQPPASSNGLQFLALPLQLSSRALDNSQSETQEGGQTQITLAADVLFDFNSATLTTAAHSELATIAQRLAAQAKGTVHIDGYTDSIGTDAYNLNLSQQRAAAVQGALHQLLGSATNLSLVATGHGATNFVASNTKPDGSDNPAGRAMNRRVTVTFNG